MFQDKEASLDTLRDIRSMMEKSARFISLSGWSGVWAGSVALVGSIVARSWLSDIHPHDYLSSAAESSVNVSETLARFLVLAAAIFVLALAGAYYFTLRKTKRDGKTLWNSASRRMVGQMAIPLCAGGIFALHFIYNGHTTYVAPICLAFYGMALINGSKYTLSDIKYLGLCLLVLGCVNLFLPAFGLEFWALGFGVLHILYGIVMWNKYDKRTAKG